VTWLKARFDLWGNTLERVPESYWEFLASPFLEASGSARVFGHAQVIEDQADVACEFSHFLCNAAHAFGFDGPDGKTAEARDVFRAVAGTYPAAVFIEIPVQDVVTAVFDAPVTSVDGKEVFSISLFWGSTGNSVGDIGGFFPALFVYGVSFDEKRLPDVGEVEVGVEFGGGPDFTGFDPAMIRGIISNKIRFLAILEIQLEILQQCGLIAFDGEVVMGLTIQA